MPKDYADRIAKLKEQREKIEARLNTLGQKAKADERKRDTRRKIIVGGAIIVQMEKDAAFAAHVGKLLNASVGRQNRPRGHCRFNRSLWPSLHCGTARSKRACDAATRFIASGGDSHCKRGCLSSTPFPAKRSTARQNLESLEGEMARFIRRPTNEAQRCAKTATCLGRGLSAPPLPLANDKTAAVFQKSRKLSHVLFVDAIRRKVGGEIFAIGFHSAARQQIAKPCCQFLRLCIVEAVAVIRLPRLARRRLFGTKLRHQLRKRSPAPNIPPEIFPPLPKSGCCRKRPFPWVIPLLVVGLA